MNTQTTSSRLPVLAIILPCYNEEAVLPTTIPAIEGLLAEMKGRGEIAPESFALYVDDGSIDGTWNRIEERHRENPLCRGLKFAGNAGHQNALLAGMNAVAEAADCAVTLDADLQDDISVIPEMVRQFRNGSHVVYGVREDRSTDTWFKRASAGWFYSVMRFLGAEIVPGHADFRLVSRFALEALREYPENNLFLRSLFPSMKLRSSTVYYARKSRLAGETKYPFWKMVAFAVKGIAVSSPVPLRVAALLGLAAFAFALLQTVAVLHSYCSGEVVPGWTSLSLLILYFGAVQLLCLAILGEYLAKVFTEVKRRPRYRVEKELR